MTEHIEWTLHLPTKLSNAHLRSVGYVEGSDNGMTCDHIIRHRSLPHIQRIVRASHHESL